MVRHPERLTAVSLRAALGAIGVAPGTGAVVLPEDLDAGPFGLAVASEGTPVAVAVIDAERVDPEAALRELAPRLAGSAIVVVRARVRGEGVLGGLRGRLVLEDVVRPLLGLPVEAVGVVEVRGLFGATLAWARLTPDAPSWIAR